MSLRKLTEEERKESQLRRQKYQREWCRARPEKVLEYNRRFREAHPEQNLWRTAKHRANKFGVEHTISVSDITIPEVCPALGTPFVSLTPYAASLDRIDSSKGYIPGNVQVISKKANAMKNDATKEELVEFAKWILS